MIKNIDSFDLVLNIGDTSCAWREAVWQTACDWVVFDDTT